MFQILFGDLLRLDSMITRERLKIIEIFQKIWNWKTKLHHFGEIHLI